MSLAPEIMQPERDLQHKHVDSAVNRDATLAGQTTLPLGGVFNAVAAEGSRDGASRPLLSSPVMRHWSGSQVRILAMRSAQQGIGNQKARHLITQISGSPIIQRSVIQRECNCGGTCTSCQGKVSEEESETAIVQRQSSADDTAVSTTADIIPSDSPGTPLDLVTRGFMESRFGHDFSDVRVHTDSRAAQSADALAANAYTTGRDIYFAAGKYIPQSKEGQHLLAHELTHTVQQEDPESRIAASGKEGAIVGSADDPSETEAEQAADAVVNGAPISKIGTETSSSVRRDLKSTSTAVWDATGRRVVRGVEGLVEDTVGAVSGWLERHAPGLMAFVRADPIEVLKEKIGHALEGTLGSFFSRIQRDGLFTVLSSLAGKGMEALASLVQNVTAHPCDTLRKIVTGLIDFQKWLNSESWALLKKGASLVGSLFSYLWNDLALPLWDAVRKFAGSVWAWTEARAKEFWDWIAPLRRGIATVWNKVKQLIGAAWEKGTDVFDWFKQKLSSAWDRVKATLQPIVGPLKIIGGMLLLLSPLGPIVVIGTVAYGLFRATQWLHDNWDHLEIIIQARKILHEQVIPWIHSAAVTVTGALHEAVKWLHQKVKAIREALAQLSDALGVNTLLRFAKSAVDWIATKFSHFADWVAGGFKKLVDAVSPTIQKIWDFFRPIAVVLAKLLLAITNPILLPIYLGAVIWLILPDCIKPPLIDYILEVMIAGIRGIPNWGFFGEEWPTIKEGIVKPLEEKRKKASPEEKIRFSNKIANMIAGPDLTGFSNLFQAAKKAPDQFMGQVEQELVGMDLTQPLPLERAPSSGEGILAQQAASAFDSEIMAPENLALLHKTAFSDGDVQADQVSKVQMQPEFFDSLELGPDGSAKFAENPNPTITSDSLRGELAGLTLGQSNAGLGGGTRAEGMERPPEDLPVEEQIRWFVSHQPKQGCEPKGAPQSRVPTEAASPGMQIFPPLTQGQRALFVWEQMKSGLRQWYECHKTAVIASIVGALVLLVVLAVLTDGVIFEVLPQIMEVIGFIFIGVSVVRMSMFIADYVAKAVAGDIAGAAKSLARGLAIGAIELLMYLLTAGTGKGATKAGEKAAQGTLEGAAQAGKRAPRPFIEAATDAGRRFLVNIRNPIGAFMRNGKAFIRGMEQGIERGVRSLRELGEKLLQKMGFRSFSAEVQGSWLFIYGIFNPKVLLAEIPLPIRTRFAATLAERPQLAGALVRLEDLTKFERLLGRNHELLERLHDLQRAAESGHTAVQFSASVRNLEEEILDELATRVAKAVNSPVRDAEGLKAFIREHPERVGEFLDAAAGRLEATGTHGIPAGRVDIPTHVPGIPQHLYDALRSRTPSDEIRDAIRATLPQGVPDPALPSRLIAGPIHADHIVPMQKITQMRGFADLTEENMLRVLNFRDNFVALSEAANTSKGTRSFYEWVTYARGGIDVDAAFRRTMMFRELELEGTLENYIDQLLRQQVLPIVQRKIRGTSNPIAKAPIGVPRNGHGQSLDQSTREFMEAGLGTDFSSVRVHTDSRSADSADALAADAYTRGRDIYFAAGKYAPTSREGQRLLAHELTHVVQQEIDPSPISESCSDGELVVGNEHDMLEAEAESTAYAYMRRLTASESSSGRAAGDRAMQAIIATQETASPFTRAGFTSFAVNPRPAITTGSVDSRLIQRQKKDVAGPEADLKSLLSSNIRRLQSEGLSAFQRGLDTVDRGAVEEAGTLVLLLWNTVLGAHEALRHADAPDLPEFIEIRRAVLSAVTLQKFQGEYIVAPPKTIDHIGDVGQYVALQTKEAAGTVKDAKAMLLLLGKRHLEYEDEEAAVRIFRDLPNPWHLGYLRAVVSAAGLERVLEAFSFENRRDLDAVFTSQKYTLERGVVGPADRVGVIEPIPTDRRVRVLRPYGGHELARELYGKPSFYESLLLPYNRAVLGDLQPDALIPAGTELVIEPELLWGRYRVIFMALELSKPKIDRPYIKASISGAAITGTKVGYTVHWPVPEPPKDAWRLNTGEVLWRPTTSMWEYAQLEWWIKNDPAKDGREEFLSSSAVKMKTLTESGATLEQSWPETGTYTVRAHLLFGYTYDPAVIDVQYTQAVVTENEKVEADAATVVDQRAPLHLQTAETYAEFQQIAAQLGVTDDELAAKPQLAGPLGLETKYYPEFLLRDLKQALADTTDEKRQKKIRWQIESLESAIEKTKSWSMRQIKGLYISSDDQRTTSVPLLTYIAPDPDAPGWSPYPLRLWDFTLEGTGTDYTDGYGESSPSTSLRALLKAFAYQAPYPTGTVRFWIDSSVLPPDFVGDKPLEPQVIDVHTHGGPWYVKAAGGIFTAAVLAVGVLTLGPEVALTAFAIYGAVTGLADIMQRLEAGTFDFDLQTGMDVLAIAGGLAAGISPVISVVRGVGEVAWLGSVARTAGVLQLGVMVGTDLERIVKAVQSGDTDTIVAAVMEAVADGALVVVTHVESKAAEADARPRITIDPAFEGVQGDLGPNPIESGAAPSTAVGTGGGKPSGPPPGQEPPTAPREGSPRAVQEEWARNLTENGLAPRPGPGAPAGPPAERGTYESVRGEMSFQSPEAAFAAYDEALARAGGREVGIFRNLDAKAGEYVVRVGDEHSVGPPLRGRWESVLHRHPNPENVLTRRMPAPQDVQNTMLSSFRAGRPVTEFIDYPIPDGRRGLVSYTVEPKNGRVTVKYERADGTRIERSFDSVRAYASHYAERTTYVDPSSSEYKWMIRDLDEFYAVREPSEFATAAGTLKPGKEPKGETARSPEAVEAPAGRKGSRLANPTARTRAELDRALQVLGQRIETLKKHPNSWEMADRLDAIRKEINEGREADASMHMTTLEQQVARARLSVSSGMFEQLYGEPSEVLGSRVIEYVPSAEAPPIDLGPDSPSKTDVTGQKLLAHVRRAVAEFDPSMLTEAERLALRDAEKSGGKSKRSSLYDAYRGSHIDRLAKKAVFEDDTLEHVYVTLNLEYGADFYDSRTGHWYDITTNKAWRAHQRKYGPTVPGKTTVPGFRLPTESQ